MTGEKKGEEMGQVIQIDEARIRFRFSVTPTSRTRHGELICINDHFRRDPLV